MTGVPAQASPYSKLWYPLPTSTLADPRDPRKEPSGFQCVDAQFLRGKMACLVMGHFNRPVAG